MIVTLLLVCKISQSQTIIKKMAIFFYSKGKRSIGILGADGIFVAVIQQHTEQKNDNRKQSPSP
jgi:hypothetical protein